MIHPDTELRKVSSEVGYGVFATAKIPRGTITWVLDDMDQIVSQERFGAMPPALQPLVERYCFRDSKGRYVICWDFGRFMNHSCAATTAGIGVLCDVAIRDIEPGEQLTCEYALHNLDETVSCRCGASNCRGQIRAVDLPAIARAIDATVAMVVPEAIRRPQILVPFMRTLDRNRLEAIFQGRESVPSCIENGLQRS